MSTAATSTPQTSAARQAAVVDLLERRARAVLSDEVAGWTSTQTVDADAPRWQRVSALPVTVWRYTDVAGRA